MTYSAAGRSHIGLLRQTNEDEFLCDLESLVFAVADGLGGLPFGELASKTVVQFLQSWTQSRKKDQGSGVNRGSLMEEMNRRVITTGYLSVCGSEIGTTLSMGVIRDDVLEISHVGDSRIYHFREDKAAQLTRDDTLETIALEQQLIPAGGKMPEHFQHTLTQFLGQQGLVNPQFSELPLQSGDRLLFCSDGISGYLELDEMAQITGSATTPDTALDKLIESVLEKGAPDNATGIALFAR